MSEKELGTGDIGLFPHTPIGDFDHDLFEFRPFLERFVARIESMTEDWRLLGLFAPWGCGKTSALKLCMGLGTGTLQMDPNSRLSLSDQCLWLPPFETWRFERAGQLELAVLWHIRKSLPKNVQRRKTLVAALGRLAAATTLAAANVTSSAVAGVRVVSEAVDALRAVDDSFASDGLVSSSPTLQMCELVERVAMEFDAVGKAICKGQTYDRVVVPIDDMDRCSPEAATRLLFSLKHLLVSDRFLFVVAVDRVALARFLTLFYGMTLDEEDSQWFLEKLFDDWVELPTPEFNRMLSKLCELPEMKARGGDKFRNRFHGSVLRDVPRNPRKFVRACERFMRLLRAGAKNRGTNETCWLLKFALCVLYAEHPAAFDALSAGLSKPHDGQKEGDRLVSFCKTYRKEIMGAPLMRGPTSAGGVESQQERPALVRWSTRLPPILARHVENTTGSFSAILEWLLSDNEGKEMKEGDIERCVMDVRDCR